MKVTIENLDKVVDRIRDKLPKQARFAASLTLNRLAPLVIADQQKEMRDSFDRPTAFTLNSLAQTKRATRDDLTAVVDFKQVAGGARTAASYLRWQVEGGQRRLKAFEKALRSVIPALGEGYLLVPAAGADLDAYGNVSRGQIVALLSYFRAFQEEGRGFKMNSTAATRARMARGSRRKLGYAYFVGNPGGRGLGIWKRTTVFGFGSAVKPVFLFVKTARYEPRYDLQYAADLTVKRQAPALFRAAMAQALATAR